MTQTTIDTATNLVTMINVFTVKRENQDKLVELLATATKEVMSKQPGFVSANLHKSLNGERVTNYAQWESREAFTAMLNNPAAREHMGPISEIASSDGNLYEVAEVLRG